MELFTPWVIAIALAEGAKQSPLREGEGSANCEIQAKGLPDLFLLSRNML